MKVITISGKNKDIIDRFIKEVKENYGGTVHQLTDTNVVNNTINLINKSGKNKSLLSELENICKDFNEIIITEMTSFIDSRKGNGLIFIDTSDYHKIQIFNQKYKDFMNLVILDYDKTFKSFMSYVNTSKK